MSHILDATVAQLVNELVTEHIVNPIEPEGKEHRAKFINSMPTLLLFRRRGMVGIATHYVLKDRWQDLRFAQMILIRRLYEQVCF
jgi:hypothetical protein